MPRAVVSLLCFVFVLISLPVSAQRAAKMVNVTSPIIAPHAEQLSLSGSFSAEQHSQLSPKEAGLVTQLWVDAGSHVKQGDRLLQLDDRLARLSITEHQSALAEAKVLAKESERLVEEAKRLRDQRHIPESELIKRQADAAQKAVRVESMQAALATAQERLKRRTLYAPFDGIITEKHTEVGQWVSLGSTVLTLTNLQQLRLDVTVPQERFSDIDIGTDVTVKPDMSPDQPINATIDTVVPVSDAQSRAFEIRIPIQQEEAKLLPGMSALVDIPLPSDTAQAVLIPRDALLIHPDGGHSVFVINPDNKAERRTIHIGERLREGVVITQGLSLDDTVVVRGNEVLNDGDVVITED